MARVVLDGQTFRTILGKLRKVLNEKHPVSMMSKIEIKVLGNDRCMLTATDGSMMVQYNVNCTDYTIRCV